MLGPDKDAAGASPSVVVDAGAVMTGVTPSAEVAGSIILALDTGTSITGQSASVLLTVYILFIDIYHKI